MDTIISGTSQIPQPGKANNPFQPFGGSPMGGATVIGGVNDAPILGPGNIIPKGQLFGFLFSVSRTMAGEYWPLYLGENTLGRGPQNSIVLNEVTVSENHVNIHIISRSGNLTVYVTDTKSKTGTLLNGELIRGEADLKSGDIITVGEHYELLVILVDPVKLSLAPVEGFVDATPAQPIMPQFPKPAMSTVLDGQIGGQAPAGGHTVIMG